MTKKEFLLELRRNLSGLPKDELEDRLNFYEEMINDRMDEGKTEEEAVADIGTTDDAVREIASKTKFSTLVKEKIRPKREIKGWEIALLILGFPLWFPLIMVSGVLILVAYILVWVLVIVTYAVEIALIGSFFSALIAGLGSLFAGELMLETFGICLLSFGGACLFVFACIPATKFTLGLSKKIFIGIRKTN